MSSNKIEIVFILPSMSGGGSQRVVTLLVNNLNRDRFNITLILLKKEGEYIKDIRDDINIIDLNISRRSYSIFKIFRYLKLIKPDILFSTIGSMNITISLLIPFCSKNIKFIARESSIVSIQNRGEKYPKLFDFLYRYFFREFDFIVSQSEYMKNDLIENFSIPKEKIVLINNPIDMDKIDKLSEIKESLFNRDKINLLAVGRLSSVKRFHLLLYLLKDLDKKYHLTIIGQGDKKRSLKELAKELGVEDRVSFLGFQQNPFKYMKQADLLVLTSAFEGFPNVILEANSCGLGVVAFNCAGGVSEIIVDGFNGFLAKDGDINSLRETILKASKFDFNREDIRAFIDNRYRLNSIIKRYEELLYASIL